MEIKWIGSPNYSSRKNYTPAFIVDHISTGSLSSMDNWFQNPKAEASSHFGVGKKGEIHQYVDVKMKAWTCGEVTNPNNPVSQMFPGVNPNFVTINIEHEGQTGDELTPEQYASSLWLHKKLMAEENILSENIIGHFIIDPVNRSGCPGTGFPWKRLKDDLTKKEDDYMTRDQIREELLMPDASWAVPQIDKALETGLISSKHDANEVLSFGVMITVINNMFASLKKEIEDLKKELNK